MPKQRFRRSKLFTPGDQPRRIANAAKLDADVVVLDLEDSVLSSQKLRALEIVCEMLDTVDFGSKEVGVRINPLSSGLTTTELEYLSQRARLDVIHAPKISSAEDVRTLEKQLVESGFGEQVLIVPYIETALGIVNAASIAKSSTRLAFLQFGSGDLSVEVGMSTDVDTLAYSRSTVVLAAVSAGLSALDTVYINFRDETGFLEHARAARRLGYKGKSCIHPLQVPIANEVFSPTESEILRAQETLAAYQTGVAEQQGAVNADGRLVDLPFVLAAEQTIADARELGLI